MSSTNLPSTSVKEAAQDLDSIMSSQLISKANPSRASVRKRHRSKNDTCDTASKKARHCESPEISVLSDIRPTVTARRSLYQPKAPEPAPREVVMTSADVHVIANPTMQQMFEYLLSYMNMMFVSLNERFNILESTLNQRITNRVSQSVNKRMNSEMIRVRKDIDGKLDTKLDSLQQSMKAEIAVDLADICKEVKC